MTKEEIQLVDKLIYESGSVPCKTQCSLGLTYYYHKKSEAEKALKYIYHKNKKLFEKLDGYRTGHNRIEDKLMLYFKDSGWHSETPRKPDYYYISCR